MIQTDAESVYNERKLAEIRDRHDEWRANHYYLDIGFLLAQLDKANQTIARFEADDERLQAMHTESEARLRQLLAEKDAEIERLNDVIRTLGLALNSAVKPRNPEHLTIKLSDHSEPEGSR
ncbi:hypothetical protein [Alicyclobacillus acidoterrestris]|uniref:Uncharacterized protein n=1 Tax=Alicyclobacillus acidoterrestris (strain ATCC 49025 / DSM 3922 / CIP 106132 / NCIMB 13137 / GD3B) TaxID=1356854 RepID=T0BUH3_ALIAG|nr:hypothetical protein [Alicyclobacillus acidoterrestris]EPZ47743.1 hypothetical protein N007_05670 [Alicyclobacillus acidoterrestris ATCC 49025]UNO47951.1 hypothetical protein K1I37_14850 [Alicyclobacillus acidoterrestris]